MYARIRIPQRRATTREIVKTLAKKLPLLSRYVLSEVQIGHCVVD
jgi:hypothetical protein